MAAAAAGLCVRARGSVQLPRRLPQNSARPTHGLRSAPLAHLVSGAALHAHMTLVSGTHCVFTAKTVGSSAVLRGMGPASERLMYCQEHGRALGKPSYW